MSEKKTLYCPLKFHSNIATFLMVKVVLILHHMVYNVSAKETHCALNTRVHIDAVMYRVYAVLGTYLETKL